MISGRLRRFPDVFVDIFGAQLRKANEYFSYGAKHSPLFLQLWWPFGDEFLELRVFGEMHTFS